MLLVLLTLGLLLGSGAWLLESRRRKRHPVPAGLCPDVTVPYEQEFELYHNAFSLCSMKSRLCLAELGVPYRSHPVDLIETGAYENIRAGFLEVNPAGTVPVLVHKGHPVYESHEQIRYAAQHAPASHPRLVPDDPEERRRMDEWVDRSSLTADPLGETEKSAGNAVPGLTLPIFATMMEQIPVWRVFEGLLFHFDKRRPLLFLMLKLRGVEALLRLKPLLAAHRRSRRHMGDHLDALEARLEESGGPWILGELYSLADVSWLVIFERLAQVDSLELFLGEGQRPHCAAYWEALKRRPAYAEAITAHGHPTVEYGTRRLREAKAAHAGLREALSTG